MPKVESALLYHMKQTHNIIPDRINIPVDVPLMIRNRSTAYVRDKSTLTVWTARSFDPALEYILPEGMVTHSRRVPYYLTKKDINANTYFIELPHSDPSIGYQGSATHFTHRPYRYNTRSKIGTITRDRLTTHTLGDTCVVFMDGPAMLIRNIMSMSEFMLMQLHHRQAIWKVLICELCFRDTDGPHCESCDRRLLDEVTKYACVRLALGQDLGRVIYLLTLR